MGSIKRDRECLMVKWKDLDDKIVLSMTSDQMESISFNLCIGFLIMIKSTKKVQI